MLISNKVVKELKEGVITKEEVVNELIAVYPIKSIVEDYVDMVMTIPTEQPKITISREEFEMLTNIFKVRGEKVVDGEVVKENRGRKRKQNEIL